MAGEHLLVITVQEPVKHWVAPVTFTRTAFLGEDEGEFATVSDAFDAMVEYAIDETGWTGLDPEDVIVLHWSATPQHPLAERAAAMTLELT